MSTTAVVRARFPRAVTNLDRYAGGAGRALDAFGHMVRFTMIERRGRSGWRCAATAARRCG